MPDSTCQQTAHVLYEEHHGWLKSWLRKRLGDTEQAADLAQDTFVRVLMLRKFDDLRQPRAYLSSIARSLMIDGMRRRRLEQAYLETLSSRDSPVEASPEQRLLVIETLMEIDRLLDGLGQRTRSVFLLAQLEGLSYVEIGRRLELSIGTVRKHAIRAMTHCLLLIED